MSERSHCHTEGTVNLLIIFYVLRFDGFSVLVNYSVYIHTYINFILSGYSAGLLLIVIWIMYSMAASMASEAQIKLNHNFNLSLRI